MICFTNGCKVIYEVGEFVEVEDSYGYIFMAVKEKVRLCLDLSCLTLYWTCMYALNSLKSR